MEMTLQMGIPDVVAQFGLDRTTSTDDQLTQLEAYVRELRRIIGPLPGQIQQLGTDIESARQYSDTTADRALTEARAEIERFGDRHDDVQAIDLRVAIAGVLITAVGVALSLVA